MTSVDYSNYKEYDVLSGAFINTEFFSNVIEFHEYVTDHGVYKYSSYEDYTSNLDGTTSQLYKLMASGDIPGRIMQIVYKGEGYSFNSNILLSSYEERLQFYDFLFFMFIAKDDDNCTESYNVLIDNPRIYTRV